MSLSIEGVTKLRKWYYTRLMAEPVGNKERNEWFHNRFLYYNALLTRLEKGVGFNSLPVGNYNSIITYTEHLAGTFEDGLQICRLCGKVLTDYTGHWASSDGSAPKGFPEGPIYVQGNMTMAIKPEKNYGADDPYIRIVVKCVGA